jgi:Ca2+/Na+ antiporter
MDLIRKIFKKSVIILIPLAALSSLIEPKKLPAGIIAGGILALLNIKGLAWGVEGLIGAEKATAKMLFLSQFRLVVLFVVITVLVYLRIVNVFGLLLGLTVVFALVLIEGYRHSKKEQLKEDTSEGEQHLP